MKNKTLSYVSLIILFAVTIGAFSPIDQRTRAISSDLSANADRPAPITKSVYVTATRTVTSKADLRTKFGGGGCPETQKENTTTTIQANLSSDQVVVGGSGDNFQLQAQGNGNSSGGKPLSGSGSVTLDSTTDKEVLKCGESSCPSTDNTKAAGSARLDLPESRISFDYNRQKHTGGFALQLRFDSPSGSGTNSFRSCNDSHSASTDQVIGPLVQMYGLTYGSFSAKNTDSMAGMGNLPPETMAAIRKSMEVSGNGGIASIVETKNGFEITYSHTVTTDTMPQGDTWQGSSQMTITTNVHISIGGKPVNYDAILVPDNDVKKWIPEGPAPQATPAGTPTGPPKPPSTDSLLDPDAGNKISFHVKLVDKANPSVEVTDVAYGVNFELTDVSSIPGFATNYPKSGGDTKPDLRFDKLMKHMSKVREYSDLSVKTTDDGGREAPAIVRSYDYAARGYLKAKVILKASGIDLDAHLDGETTEKVQLPYDSNNNHIADQWEKNNGVFDKNYDEKWDSLHLDGNSHDGDGFTLFEKYRGFVINGKHESLDPKKKHIFVIDNDNLGLASHFGLFEKAADGQIKVHICKPEEMDQIANKTETEGKGGDQYAIIAKKETLGPDVLGKMFPEPSQDPDNRSVWRYIKSPKEADHLGIAAASGPDLDYTLAHELSHGLGVRHHGDARGEHYDKDIEKSVLLAPNFELVDILGADLSKSVVSEDPQRFTFDIAPKFSQASGDPECIMAYNNFYDLASINGTDSRNGKTYITRTRDPHRALPDGHTFCRGAEGKLWNDKDHKPGPAFGDAKAGNCWSQINIKTW
jgi:hypothetical protein